MLPGRNSPAISAVAYGANFRRHLRVTADAINAADGADAAAQLARWHTFTRWIGKRLRGLHLSAASLSLIHPKLVAHHSKFQEPPLRGKRLPS